MNRPDVRILSELRDSGVRAVSFHESGDVKEVEFFPSVTKPDASPAVDIAKLMGSGPDMCRCGHDETMHGGQGLCLIGCDAKACAPQLDDSCKVTMAAV